MRVLALDYGRARTGVAISDPSGTLARPFGVVERAATPRGLEEIAAIARREAAGRLVVGLPLTLKGERGEQARETERFVEALRAVLDLPVETFDERFTSVLAEREEPRSGATGSVDARAAAHLLSTYLEWTSNRP